jgi:hypothetical protein
VSYAISPVTPFETSIVCASLNLVYTEPFGHISFAELVQQAGLGSAFAELLSARCCAAPASKRMCPNGALNQIAFKTAGHFPDFAVTYSNET